MGSLSKTFTAVLATYASQQGKLSFADPVSEYLPALKGNTFDHVSLLNLATHTSGLPLFVPAEVNSNAQLMAYYKHWRPQHPVGSYRVYSNLGIGLLGMITAQSLNLTFADAMEKQLLPALGMTHTYVNVPPDQMQNYAQGYNRKDRPVRIKSAHLDEKAYGLKSNSLDLIRYLDANMHVTAINPAWQNALNATHTGYYRTSGFSQDMMWESYPYPPDLKELIAGNAAGKLRGGLPVSEITPPEPDNADTWYNKTGSTNGFSSYAVFVPSRKIAVVMLANKWFPNDARIRATYAIMQELKK